MPGTRTGPARPDKENASTTVKRKVSDMGPNNQNKLP
jgi:hypothetical protein